MKAPNVCFECGVVGAMQFTSAQVSAEEVHVWLECTNCGESDFVEMELATPCRMCEVAPVGKSGLCVECGTALIERRRNGNR